MSALRTTPALTTIARRLDAIALQQLREECARLAAENDQLRQELGWAEQAAESWRDDALRLMEEACADGTRQPGITQAGALVTIPATGAVCPCR